MSWTIKCGIYFLNHYRLTPYIVVYLLDSRFLASVFDTRLLIVAVVMSEDKQVLNNEI